VKPLKPHSSLIAPIRLAEDCDVSANIHA